MEIQQYKTEIKERLLQMVFEYNSNVENYEENGEEDFNEWLNMFKDKD